MMEVQHTMVRCEIALALDRAYNLLHDKLS